MTMDSIKQKAPWWMSMLATFGIGGGSGSMVTFYMIEKIEARQSNSELWQQAFEKTYYTTLIEISSDIAEIKGELKSMNRHK